MSRSSVETCEPVAGPGRVLTGFELTGFELTGCRLPGLTPGVQRVSPTKA